jgi:hypothetical protein
MARIRTHTHYSDTRAELSEYKNARRGAVEDAFWDEDELVDHQKAGTKKKRSQTRGCPENNHKSHVYVWVETTRYRIRRHDVYGWIEDKSKPHTVKTKTCCGCGKVTNRIYDWTDYFG